MPGDYITAEAELLGNLWTLFKDYVEIRRNDLLLEADGIKPVDAESIYDLASSLNERRALKTLAENFSTHVKNEALKQRNLL